ncbi:hypothetical protein TSAR_017046 [Trichomalopsis sarcophagae]|uniref:Uncharacterized protein n=1 Tax=Trichomalopsis sarcophagae TaxID=543379 RepID=A0A232EDM7_9HYME|nr:hypothetical protein TSAR_017046 [Trichomalopsis sarcophagae]
MPDFNDEAGLARQHREAAAATDDEEDLDMPVSNDVAGIARQQAAAAVFGQILNFVLTKIKYMLLNNGYFWLNLKDRENSVTRHFLSVRKWFCIVLIMYN